MRVYVVSEGRAEDDDVLDIVPENEMEAYIEAKSKELEAEMLRWEVEWRSPNKVMSVVSSMARFHRGWVTEGQFGVHYTITTEGNPNPHVRENKVEYIVREMWSGPKNAQPTTFQSGDKVTYRPDGKVYDFGYYGQTGKAVIYSEGERNMQDSFAVDPQELSLR